MNAKVKKRISIGVNIVIWIFLIFAIVMTVLVLVANATRGKGLASLGGRAHVTVLSGSMEPEFYEGDLIYVHTDITDEQKMNLEVGDVISFYFDKNNDGVADEINTHRIYKVFSEDGAATYYETKGDNVENSDGRPYVNFSDVLGVYSSEHLGIKGEKVTGFGSVLSFFQTPVGFMAFVVVPMAVFFIYELINFVLIIVRMRGEKAAAVRALSEEEIKKRAIEEYLREQEAQKAVETPVFAETVAADVPVETEEASSDPRPKVSPRDKAVETPTETQIEQPPAVKTAPVKKPATKRTTTPKSGVSKPKTGGTVSRVGGTAKKSTAKPTEKPTTDKTDKEDK